MALAPPYPISKSLRVGEAFAVLGAGTHNLTEQSGKPARCARRLLALADGNLTLLEDPKGVDAPPGAVLKGFQVDADISRVTCSASIMVFW